MVLGFTVLTIVVLVVPGTDGLGGPWTAGVVPVVLLMIVVVEVDGLGGT